ncbi:MAG: hypothetical protein R3344_09730, partial [Acidobacteriota bacterium]|nr:hypothetical protein [Acidobacteriota bacterium]
RNNLDGVELAELGTHTRSGIRLVYPVTARNGVAVDLSTGLTTRLGANYDSLTVAYQYMWVRGVPSDRGRVRSSR